MAKDYYFVLGIGRGADRQKIKRAYRTIAKKYHPDISHSRQGSEKFREIREAYETLMDEDKRKRHDRELNRQTSGTTAIPKRGRGRSTRPFDPLKNFMGSTDTFFEGFVPGFFDRESRRAGKKDLYYEAILSPKEAENGGLFPVSIPVIEPCPACGQDRFRERFFCTLCSGHGTIRSQRSFSLGIPPGVRHGTEVSLSMEDIGLRDFFLHLTVIIDPALSAQ